MSKSKAYFYYSTQLLNNADGDAVMHCLHSALCSIPLHPQATCPPPRLNMIPGSEPQPPRRPHGLVRPGDSDPVNPRYRDTVISHSWVVTYVARVSTRTKPGTRNQRAKRATVREAIIVILSRILGMGSRRASNYTLYS